jgi:BlaI family penicillinase repressor
VAVLVKENKIKLSKLELEVMDAVWKLGQGSIREVHESLPERKRPAYTTVQTIVGRLEEKGAVRRVKKISNAFIFEPTVSRESTHKKLIADFLQLIGGARPLVAHLVKSGELSLEDVREMEKATKELEKTESQPTRSLSARGK